MTANTAAAIIPEQKTNQFNISPVILGSETASVKIFALLEDTVIKKSTGKPETVIDVPSGKLFPPSAF